MTKQREQELISMPQKMIRQSWVFVFELALVAVLVIFTGSDVGAHPVSFKGGVGFMSSNSKEMNELTLAYSATSRIALGLTYLRDPDAEFYVPRVNLLARRWHQTDSQGNLYLGAGMGNEWYDGESTPVQLANLVADWESRRLYVYFEHLYLAREARTLTRTTGHHTTGTRIDADYNYLKFRMGFAPFLADYSDLNIWFIAQADRHPGEVGWELTQFLRFYFRNVLWEFGADVDGDFRFNLMLHY